MSHRKGECVRADVCARTWSQRQKQMMCFQRKRCPASGLDSPHKESHVLVFESGTAYSNLAP
jgi:hypothetical protein